MSTFRELTYLVLDELKLFSDDSDFNSSHVVFLLSKYRSFLLKQRYSDIKKLIPENNYQTLCLDLIEVPAISGEPCEGGTFLRTKEKIPALMTIGNVRAYPIDYYNSSEITYISRDRMRYVGYNRFMSNIIYCSLAPDNYMYLKSNNPQFLYLKKMRVTGIFQDAMEAFNLSCQGDDKPCDILDSVFPLEEALIQPLIELVVKELTGAIYKPEDPQNNATDDLSNISNFIRNNMKNEFQKQLL